MIKKVIFLVPSPFNKRDYDRYGMETFMQNGFDISVWDFTPFLFPDVFMAYNPPDPIEWKNHICYYKKEEALAAIRKERKGSFVISLIPYGIDTFEIFKAISRNKIPYSVSALSNIPQIESQNDLNKIIVKIKSLSPKKLIKFCLLRITFRAFGIRPANILITAAGKTPLQRSLVNNETKVLWMHTLDYDIYLKNQATTAHEIDTAVFIDNYLPFHPDALYSKEELPLTPEEYYPPLYKLFDQIEQKSCLKVVIAAHPRSNYEKMPDLFPGRNIIRGKTAELIRDSKLVILNFSTALSFAVLYKKPMIFFTSDSLEKTMYGKYILQLAALFRKMPINISREIDFDISKEFFIYEDGYTKYKNDYIKMEGSEELPYWQILCNQIKSLDS